MKVSTVCLAVFGAATAMARSPPAYDRQPAPYGEDDGHQQQQPHHRGDGHHRHQEHEDEHHRQQEPEDDHHHEDGHHHHEDGHHHREDGQYHHGDGHGHENGHHHQGGRPGPHGSNKNQYREMENKCVHMPAECYSIFRNFVESYKEGAEQDDKEAMHEALKSFRETIDGNQYKNDCAKILDDCFDAVPDY